MGMEKDSIVTLVFTATGDDLDHGIGMSGMTYRMIDCRLFKVQGYNTL
jgi:hypothetical protein